MSETPIDPNLVFRRRFFGPSSHRATKMVVTIHREGNESHTLASHTWSDEGANYWKSKKWGLAAEKWALDQRSLMKDERPEEIAGCAHEPGVDHPAGEPCPKCPYWSDRPRHLAELGARIGPDRILEVLSADTAGQPFDELDAAEFHREALRPRLLANLEECLASPGDCAAGAKSLFDYSLLLLAKGWETSALPLVLKWFRLNNDDSFDLSSDLRPHMGARILASVAGSDTQAIRGLIVEHLPDDFATHQAFLALALLAAWRKVPLAEVENILRELAETGALKKSDMHWSSLLDVCLDLGLSNAFPLLEEVAEAGQHMEEYRRLYEMKLVRDGRVESGLDMMANHHPPITQVAQEAWRCLPLEVLSDEDVKLQSDLNARKWDYQRQLIAQLDRKPARPPARDPLFDDDAKPLVYRAPPKVGPNDRCPCGSGKKFKKCCQGKG